MKKSSKLYKSLLNLDVFVASVALVILVGCTFAGVIARYVVGQPFGWIEEIQAALIIWVVFAAGGAAYRTGNHSSIELLYEIFPKPVRKLLDVCIALIVTAVLGFLCYTSIQYIKLFIQTGRTTAVLSISYVLIYSIVPISCVLQVINYYIVTIFGYDDETEKLVEEETIHE